MCIDRYKLMKSIDLGEKWADIHARLVTFGVAGQFLFVTAIKPGVKWLPVCDDLWTNTTVLPRDAVTNKLSACGWRTRVESIAGWRRVLGRSSATYADFRSGLLQPFVAQYHRVFYVIPYVVNVWSEFTFIFIVVLFNSWYGGGCGYDSCWQSWR